MAVKNPQRVYFDNGSDLTGHAGQLKWQLEERYPGLCEDILRALRGHEPKYVDYYYEFEPKGYLVFELKDGSSVGIHTKWLDRLDMTILQFHSYTPVTEHMAKMFKSKPKPKPKQRPLHPLQGTW